MVARVTAHNEELNKHSDSLFKPYEFEGVIIGQKRVDMEGMGKGYVTVEFTFSPTYIQPDPTYRPVDKFFDFSQPDSCKVFIEYHSHPIDEEDRTWLGEKIYKREGKVYVVMSRGIQLDSLFLRGRTNHPYYRNKYLEYKP